MYEISAINFVIVQVNHLVNNREGNSCKYKRIPIIWKNIWYEKLPMNFYEV